MNVFILTYLDETSWANTRKLFKGVYESKDLAIRAIPKWARDHPIMENQFGADGITYLITKHEVMT